MNTRCVNDIDTSEIKNANIFNTDSNNNNSMILRDPLTPINQDRNVCSMKVNKKLSQISNIAKDEYAKLNQLIKNNIFETDQNKDQKSINKLRV